MNLWILFKIALPFLQASVKNPKSLEKEYHNVKDIRDACQQIMDGITGPPQS